MSKYLPFLMIWVVACGAAAADRPTGVAGMFYPADPIELSRSVDAFLSQAPAPAKMPGPLVALVVPHAGYEFSAPVAATGYRQISGGYDTVVVMGTAHYAMVDGAALYARGAFLTPLGRVPVDERLAARLIKADPADFRDEPTAYDHGDRHEHSVEVQLPFLIKRLKPGWKLLPIIMSTEDPAVCARVGQVLAEALKGRKALIIASSDLSHYPPAAVADLVDHATLKALERLDPDYFWLANRLILDHHMPGESVTWCGQAAVTAAMVAARALGADRGVVLSYANSGSSGLVDPGRSVGYAAVAMVNSGQPSDTGIALDEKQKHALLALARATVADGAKGKQPETRLMDDPALNLPAAVFVTLTERGRLRGCVGTTEPHATLRDAVAWAGYAAAFEDQRFSPVTAAETPGLHFEISILSAAKRVASAEAVVPKKNGVIVSRDGHSGLFLPQVWEQIPDKDAFLSELCAQKAGLPRDCWKDAKTALSVFTVSAF